MKPNKTGARDRHYHDDDDDDDDDDGMIRYKRDISCCINYQGLTCDEREKNNWKLQFP